MGPLTKRPFKIYLGLLILLTLWGLKQSYHFSGQRAVASDCTDMATTIIQHSIPEEVLLAQSKKSAAQLEHYRFKNSIWNKILMVREFEHFDENEYFRLLEIYKDSSGSEKNLLAMNPVSIEQKLALIEAIQLKFSHFENLPSIQDEIQKLNSYKLKKLERLMKNFDLNSKVTRENLESFSSEFFLILKGPPLSLLDYFTKNKTARMNERMLRVLQEDMLIRGLKGTLERIPLRANYSPTESARHYIKKVMKYKAWRILVLPYDLPWVDRIKISDELLEGILVDGLNKHEPQLIAELKRQNLIDHYERFRKVYRPVAYGVGFYFYYQKFQEFMAEAEEKEEARNEEAKKIMLEDFQKLSEALASVDTVEKSDQDLKEMQFQRVLQSYKDRYQQGPTSEEYQELRQKIFGVH